MACFGEFLVVLNFRIFAASFDYYGDRVDPWDTRHSRAVQQPDGLILSVEVNQGRAVAVQVDPVSQSIAEVELRNEDLTALGFPKEALQPPVSTEAWEERLRWDGSQDRRPVDLQCPRRGDGHLAKATVEVLETLGRDHLHHRSVNVGGMYGAGMPDMQDDPVVEAVRWDSSMHVLCIGCGQYASIERLEGYHHRFEHREMPANTDLESSSFTVPIPEEWRTPDILRIESMPGGVSCLILRRLMQVMRPTLVVLIVHGQIPPPVKFSTLRCSGRDWNDAVGQVFYSCSVSAVAAILQVHGMFLLRLSGPYALFIRKDDWRSTELPLDESECYRHVEAWGVDLFPISFVRDWIFSPQIEKVASRIHRNFTQAFADLGSPLEPFMLSI